MILNLFTGRELTPGAEWVVRGEGLAFRLFAAKQFFITSKHLVHKLQIPWDLESQSFALYLDQPENLKYKLAFEHLLDEGLPLKDWLYDFVDKGIENFHFPCFIPHARIELKAPRIYFELKSFFLQNPMTGIVWWRNLNDLNCEKVKLESKEMKCW